MQDEERAAAAAGALAQRVDQQDLVREIEAGGRLVEDQESRVLREGAGEEDALPLATGEL